MRRKTVITGVGAVSALGDSPHDLHAALCRGETAARPVTAFGERTLPKPGTAAGIQDFTPVSYLGEQNFRPLDRAGQLTISAAHLALESGGWTSQMREETELDLVVGTTFCSAHTITQFDRNALLSGPKYAKPLDFANTVINAAAGQTAIWHNLRGANTTVAAGKVSGLRALKHAQIQVEHGLCNVALVGGVEELGFENYFAFLQSNHLHTENHGSQAVPFQRNRDGFVLGEGAGFAVIEDSESAAARGAKVLAELLGHGSCYDISRGQDEQNAVARCAESIESALTHAGITAADIDFISSSASGGKQEDRFEALALKEAFGDRLESIPVTAIGGGLGETLGASGIFQLIAAIEAAREGRLHGVAGISEAYDEALPALRIAREPVEGEFKTGLLLSLGLDGSSAATVISVG